MKETNLMRLIMVSLSKRGFRMFRNNTGKAYVGNSYVRIAKSGMHFIEQGDMIIKSPRIFHAGLIKGSSDLIGWKTTEITQDMVGKKIAIFTAVEVKTPRGKPSDEQINFINQVNNNGGIATIMKSENDPI